MIQHRVKSRRIASVLHVSILLLLCESISVQAQVDIPNKDNAMPPHETSVSSAVTENLGYWWFCDASDCSGQSALEQLPFLAECLAGPATPNTAECSCANLSTEHRVTLRDFAVFQNHPFPICEREVSVVQAPGLGYCREEGTIYRANVIETFDGTVLLTGAFLARGDPADDECLFGIDYEFDCFIAIPFLPVAMTSQEISSLNAKLNALPTSGGCCDGAWDPCIIRYVNFNGRTINDYCLTACFTGGFEYLFTFLEQIANH